MRKNKIFRFALVTLLIILAISISLNIKNASERNRISRIIINTSFYELVDISRNLDSLLIDLGNDSALGKETRNNLVAISQNFIKLDTVLKQYAGCFQPKGISRNVYTGILDFAFISNTLIYRTGAVNDNPYAGILVDDFVSKNEARYLAVLKEDISLIVTAMASIDNPLQANQSLTVSQMDKILGEFFDKWSFHNEESPYFLLRAE